VPILLLANLSLGVYLNLSIWYKLTGQTRFGAWISIFGAIVTIVFLFWLIPLMGYTGAAWATLICYAAMMIVSYVVGQKNYPVPYNIPRLLLFVFAAIGVWVLSIALRNGLSFSGVKLWLMNTFLFLAYIGVMWKIQRGDGNVVKMEA
jgi:O-antigen/teichoic acid export membrane protein